MLIILAAQWPLLLFRGVLALTFGASLLLWPAPTIMTIAGLFAVYALLNGLAALVMAVLSLQAPYFAGPLLQGVFGTGLGGFMLVLLRVDPSRLSVLLASWAMVEAIVAMGTAAALRRDLLGEWPMTLTASLSLALASLLVVQRADGPLPLLTALGLYAVLTGLSYTMFAMRMRQLAQELAEL